MRLHKSTLVVLGLALAATVFAVPAFGKKHGTGPTTDAAATVTITAMENASVKADTAGDSSFVEKNYVDNFSGGSSWGNWETKQSILADIATYKSTYDTTYHGEHRARTILSTDTFARQDGSWKQVASHSSELAK
jgi:ethanolamine utilization microcompartment shell protein EutS